MRAIVCILLAAMAVGCNAAGRRATQMVGVTKPFGFSLVDSDTLGVTNNAGGNVELGEGSCAGSSRRTAQAVLDTVTKSLLASPLSRSKDFRNAVAAAAAKAATLFSKQDLDLGEDMSRSGRGASQAAQAATAAAVSAASSQSITWSKQELQDCKEARACQWTESPSSENQSGDLCATMAAHRGLRGVYKAVNSSQPIKEYTMNKDKCSHFFDHSSWPKSKVKSAKFTALTCKLKSEQPSEIDLETATPLFSTIRHTLQGGRGQSVDVTQFSDPEAELVACMVARARFLNTQEGRQAAGSVYEAVVTGSYAGNRGGNSE